MFKKIKNNFLTVFMLISILLCVFLFSGCASEAKADEEKSAVYIENTAIHIDNVMSELLEENNDDYAKYFTAEEYKAFYEDYVGSFGGIGVYLTKEEGADYCIIYGVMNDKPADKAGILPGDEILAVDGENMFGVDSSELASKTRGEVNTEVTLTVRHLSGVEEDITIMRTVIEVETVVGEFLPNLDGIAYIGISEFTTNTPSEFLAVLDTLTRETEIKGIVLDLRNNGGGALSAAEILASFFVPANEVLLWQKSAEGLDPVVSSVGVKFDIPMIILQNEYSASSSEIFIGAMKDHGLAKTVGVQSYGKGITQLIYQLSDGGGLRFTQTKYLTPNKTDLHGVGLAPDFEVKNDEEFILNFSAPNLSKDIQLQKAIELLSK